MINLEEYKELIENKENRCKESGFKPYKPPDFLFEFQKYITRKGVKKGKFAIFADCGMGKTLMQLEWARQVNKYTNKPVLILAPLSVRIQTKDEAHKFGYKLKGKIDIYNYEQLKNIDVSKYSGIVLDESSILKNFEGKFRNLIINSFKDFEYKLCCTATPSPNDPMELGNHAEFLDIMKRNEMLAMYFTHDGGDTSKWRLKGHGKQKFYQWVSEWAVMLNKPSDIGFDDNGFILPKLNIEKINVKITKKKRRNIKDGFNLSNRVNATNYNQELRNTFYERLDKTVELINEINTQIIVWVKHNKEGDYLEKKLSDSKQIAGHHSHTYKENTFNDFKKNKFQILITKTKIGQFGLNFQNCPIQIFPSPDFSFEGFYQAVRRSWRFGQKNQVRIYLIVPDSMGNVYENIDKKQKEFMDMQKYMATSISKAINDTEKLVYDKKEGDSFVIERGDAVQLSQNIKSNSIGFSHFSPPFAELYTYSSYAEDMGNTKNYREFFKQFIYLIEQLYRITQPGRLCALHVANLPIQKGKEGYIGMRDFCGLVIRNFERRGWIWHDEIVIWKDPVTEMQRTKSLGLLHKQLKKDSSMSRTGIPDKILVFRKPGENNNPIEHRDFDPTDEGNEEYGNEYFPVSKWQKWASPVWFDINYSNTLQFRSAKDKEDEKHIAPLQLDTVHRCIKLWSNRGDLVYDPFMGIGTVGYEAIRLGREFLGHEIKKSYFDQSYKNLVKVNKRQKMKLF